MLAYTEFGGKGNSLKIPINVDLQLVRQQGEWGIFEYAAQANRRGQGWILMQDVKPGSSSEITGSSYSSKIGASTSPTQQSAQSSSPTTSTEAQTATLALNRFDGKWRGSAKSRNPTRCGSILLVEMSIHNGSVRGEVTSTGWDREGTEILGKVSEDGRIEIRDKDLVLDGVFSAEAKIGEGVVDMRTKGCKGPFEVTKVYWP